MDGRRNPYQEISNFEWGIIFILCLPFYLFFSFWYDQPFRGFVAALSAAVVMTVAWALRPLKSARRFWVMIFLLGIAHLLLVYFLPYTGEFRFGYAFFPIAVLDAYLSAKLIIFICGVR